MASAQAEAAAGEARRARGELGVGLDAALSDVLELVEDTARLPVTILPLPEGLSGACLRERKRTFLFVNGNDDPVRQRFTLAHEYGHAWLGHVNILDTAANFTRAVRDPREVQANAFAAEFLAPAEAVDGWLRVHGHPELNLETVVRLGVYFGISARAARYRLEAAGRLPSARQRRALDDQIGVGEHRDLLYRLGIQEKQDSIAAVRRDGRPRLPARLHTLGIAGFESGILTLERLADGLWVDPEALAAKLEVEGIVRAADEEAPDTTGDEGEFAAELDELFRDINTGD